VASGLTFVVPLAEVDANVPGVIVSVAAPDVVQLSVLIAPKAMPVGLAVKEVIVGRFGWVTVTLTSAVTDPVLFVAVSVYVVVAVGLSATEPVPEVEAKFPGAMVTLVAPCVFQLSVVLAPAVINAGLAVNEEMVGAGSCFVIGIGEVQPASPIHAASNSPSAQTTGPGILRKPELSFPMRIERAGSMRSLSVHRDLQRVWVKTWIRRAGECFETRIASAQQARSEFRAASSGRDSFPAPNPFTHAAPDPLAAIPDLSLTSTLHAESGFGYMTKVTCARNAVK